MVGTKEMAFMMITALTEEGNMTGMKGGVVIQWLHLPLLLSRDCPSRLMMMTYIRFLYKFLFINCYTG
jgi:hypothetical protein